MKRLKTVRFFRRELNTDASDNREPTILDHGDPITVRLTRELEDRRRRLSLGENHPVGL
ncbi:MAG: hypothetical protein JJ919_01140 [Henriciella sp.]|nr:hypothetical protein [Henriciella sp.]